MRGVREALRGPGGVPRERQLHGGDPHLPPGEVIRGHQLRADHGGARLHRCVSEPDGDQHQECTEPGVRSVADYQKLLDRLDSLTRVLSLGVFGIAVIMLVSAIGLVANTLRMGMFARRKEIGIMRLVGATNWRIRVPFLIEGMVEALLGAASAIAGLFLVKVFVVDRLRGTAPWLPLIKNTDVVAVMPWILLAAALVAIVAGTIGMRRFLDV